MKQSKKEEKEYKDCGACKQPTEVKQELVTFRRLHYRSLTYRLAEGYQCTKCGHLIKVVREASNKKVSSTSIRNTRMGSSKY